MRTDLDLGFFFECSTTIGMSWSLPDNTYDLGILIIPKQHKDKVREFPLVEQYRRVCKKVSVM